MDNEFGFYTKYKGYKVLAHVMYLLECFSKRVNDGNVKKMDWKDYYLQILVTPR